VSDQQTIQTFKRTPEGVRDALLAEMEDIRAGIATPQEAVAFAACADSYVSVMRAELHERERQDKNRFRHQERLDRLQDVRLEAIEQKKMLLLEHKENSDTGEGETSYAYSG
tara:strand:+ start:2400 stop:2735 length:336 start_codon:yes stop_codon:yes gene_type:complete